MQELEPIPKLTKLNIPQQLSLIIKTEVRKTTNFVILN